MRQHQQQRTFVRMAVDIGGASAGELVFELFAKVCPKTCKNFVSLCTGALGTNERGVNLTYVGSKLHRIQQGGWVQGGDVVDGTGAGGDSIYGETFPDENFVIRHNSRGVLSMARAASCHSILFGFQ
jgi:cyclophilin family peptidyl-prolyl cis-trans isomerase